MLKGTVSQYNPRRGTGVVRPAHGEDRIPFALRPGPTALQPGDPVEFTLVGGMTGVAARQVRRVRDAA